MTSPLRRLALAGAAVLILSSCGGADDPETAPTSDATDSSTESSTAPPVAPSDDPTGKPRKSDRPDAPKDSTETEDTEETVTRARFCSDIDPALLGRILDLDGLKTVVDTVPGQGSPYWTCTIAQTTGTSVGITMNILDEAADPSSVAGFLNTLATSFGPSNCTNVGDEALGAGTGGIDCSGTSSGTGFTMVARAAIVGGTQIECLLASYGADDLASLRAAAPEVCGLFRARVVR